MESGISRVAFALAIKCPRERKAQALSHFVSFL
jgi:hypothetical protein